MDGSRYRGKAPYLCISSVFFRFPSISLPPAFLPPATCLLLGMYFSPLHNRQRLSTVAGDLPTFSISILQSFKTRKFAELSAGEEATMGIETASTLTNLSHLQDLESAHSLDWLPPQPVFPSVGQNSQVTRYAFESSTPSYSYRQPCNSIIIRIAG